MTPPKAAKGWVVVNRNGDPIPPAYSRRVDVIRQWVGPEEGWRNRWRWWKRQGCRIAKCTITVSEDER